MQDINGYERFIGLLPGCYSMGVSHPETFVAGANLVLNSAEAPLTALTIYGHSTQDGTPSPDNPVPIVSAGDDGEINVSVSDGGTQSQTLTLSTPNGLPGIPVDSGGNYTDESGQQWICDEIDLARGKYVQRVSTYLIRTAYTISNSRQQNPDYFGCAEFLGLDGIGYNKNLMSDKLVFVGISKNIDGSEITIVNTNGNIVFGLKKSVVSEETVGAVTNYLSENPITILYALKEPIETDLPAEEIAAYKALHTYSPTTTVSNDAEAWMKVGYYGLTAIQKLEKEALLINGGKSKWRREKAPGHGQENRIPLKKRP